MAEGKTMQSMLHMAWAWSWLLLLVALLGVAFGWLFCRNH